MDNTQSHFGHPWSPPTTGGLGYGAFSKESPETCSITRFGYNRIDKKLSEFFCTVKGHKEHYGFDKRTFENTLDHLTHVPKGGIDIIIRDFDSIKDDFKAFPLHIYRTIWGEI